MTAFVSAGTGNWHDGATWGNASPGVEGTDYPGSGDSAQVNGGYTVTVAAGVANLRSVYCNGGILAMTAGTTLNFDDLAGLYTGGVHFMIYAAAGSGFNSNGTAASPCIIKSASANPTYRIKTRIDDVTPDTRTMDFSYLVFQGSACFLGNDTRYVHFNTGDVTNDGVVEVPTPLHRPQKIDAYYIRGRDYGRVAVDGGHAGTIEVSGIIPWASFDWQVIADMRDAQDKVAFQSPNVTLHSARIEDFRYGRRGGAYVPFTLTLIEDL